ncbi:MAG: UDP-N-acetylmuramoyl-tripeptide--D-alanyl-D-alanine ligase [Propioniciclava sp.]|uniref:UDP-N-acetylmuramoyl-tripeptide--D-alanyl-D- alanine ligase n=1 Tax=Propioniciclava sp. TaxID=2038686 RepID=UPI0039E3447F
MERITVGALASVIGGRPREGDDSGALVGPRVVIDSREAGDGALFVALPGERTDGHAFVGAAAAAGAGAALVAHPVEADLPQVIVEDPLAGLAALARTVVDAGRARGLRVIGVTGSSGKTSTKDLISQVLGAFGPTVAPPGSFNNEIGAPLTACRVDATTRYLVSEMGARGPGHIAALTAITPPDVGAVLNVGSAHLGEFGSVEGIAAAKGELVEALDADGWAVLNADDPQVAAMASRTTARLALVSARGEPDAGALRVWASGVTADDTQRHAFTLHAAGQVCGSAPVSLRVLGAHNVSNAVAAAACALALGLPLAGVADALSAAGPVSRWRMELARRADGLTIVNDAYNANPDSMSAALHSLHGLRRAGGRLVAVLGDMLELGEDAVAAHRATGALAAGLGIDELWATGEFAGALTGGFADSGGGRHHQGSKEEIVRLLAPALGPADVVLVKASRGLALETVADALAAPDDEGARA